MEYRPKSTLEIRNRGNINNFNNMNIYDEKDIQQSPKIYSNKLRKFPEEKKLFSMLDINDKITNSKGTSLAQQYKRLTQEEINKYFKMDKITGWSYDKPLINKYLKRIQTSKASFNNKNIFEKKDLPNIDNKIDNQKKIRHISQENILNNKNNILECDKVENNNLSQVNINHNKKKILSNSNYNIKENNFIEKKDLQNKQNQIQFNINKTKFENRKPFIYTPSRRNDSWMPKNYQNYELLVKNPNLLFLKLKEDSLKRKIPFETSKEIRQRMNDTDVFFVKNKIIQNNSLIGNKKNNSTIYTSSDIFGLKNDKVSLSKCGETYLFKENLKAKYTSVNESNSKWQANSNLPNLVNYHSTEFNILCPDKKNNYKTKQNIVEECKIINKNNSSSIKNMFFNPTHKQKGLAEFIDITQNGSGNPGREFVKSYKNNPLCFQKNSDVCGTFGDIHLDYKNICLRPFVKDKIIK